MSPKKKQEAEIFGRQSQEIHDWIDGIIYLRLSDEKQVRGEINSLDVQEMAAREHCEKNKINVIAVYVDRGWSGRKSNRPDWRRMNDHIASGEPQAVVAYKLERCARNTREGIDFIDTCTANGCRLISVTEYIDLYTPLGRKNTIDLLSCAEYESRNMGSKVSKARKKYAGDGLTNGGKYVPGFVKSSIPSVPKHDPLYANVILDTYKKLASGISLLEIEKDLASSSILTPVYNVTCRGGKTKTLGGCPIRTDQLEKWIRNPMYKGYVFEKHHVPGEGDSFTFVRGQFEPIVTEELWAAANKKLDESKSADTYQIQEQDKWFHPLKGLLYCSICGSAMSPRPSGKKGPSGKPYLYYRCRGAAADRKNCTSPVAQLPARLIEDLIYGYLGKMSERPEVIDALVGASQHGKKSKIRKLGAEIKTLNADLKNTKKEIENLAEVAAKLGLDSFDDIHQQQAIAQNAKYKEIQARIYATKSEQRALKDEEDYRERIQSSLGNFASAIRTLSQEEQRELIQLVIHDISIGPSSKSNIESCQRVLVEIQLKMGSLVNSAPQRGQKLKVKLEMTLTHGKGISARTSGNINLTVGRQSINSSKAKSHLKQGKHQIHRADKILEIMSHRSWTAADYARQHKMSRSAVSQILRWHKLSKDCQDYLRSLSDPKLIRGSSNLLLSKLLKLPNCDQCSALKAALNTLV